MSVVLFLGPTLPRAAAQALLEAQVLPPAAQGDVYRAAQRKPRAIGIVDGYFEWVPSVWHKEILWALAEGIPVFGCSSIGALRAAELAPFGMVGVGWVFQAFRDGLLEDDDEVAVLHGPAEAGYVAVTEAMVNIRRTLQRAVAERIVDPAVASSLQALAKGLFYQRRSYDHLLDKAAQQGIPAAALGALRAWLPRGQVDQKADDARAMLTLMRERLAAGEVRPQVAFEFQYTDTWHDVVKRTGTAAPGD